MRRRTLLASLSALGTLGAAGCVADPDDAPGADPSGSTPTNATPTTDDGSNDAVDPAAEPVETLSVGTRDGVPFPENNGPHGLEVLNDADRARRLGLRLSAGSKTELDRVLTVPAGRPVEVTLNEPATYTLAVAVDGTTAGTVTVPRRYFDCNASTTRVAVDADGALDTSTLRTLVGCPGPEVVGRSFRQGEGGCGGDETASVSVADETVRVEGRMRTPVPCYDLALASVDLRDADGTDDVLVVTVATAGQRGACVECVGSVPYTAEVDLAHAYPSNVRVVHERPDGTATVAEWSR